MLPLSVRLHYNAEVPKFPLLKNSVLLRTNICLTSILEHFSPTFWSPIPVPIHNLSTFTAMMWSYLSWFFILAFPLAMLSFIFLDMWIHGHITGQCHLGAVPVFKILIPFFIPWKFLTWSVRVSLIWCGCKELCKRVKLVWNIESCTFRNHQLLDK